jgi:hypothetical protein
VELTLFWIGKDDLIEGRMPARRALQQAVKLALHFLEVDSVTLVARWLG